MISTTDANDACFQSPHHITSVTGLGIGGLGSPEVSNFMNVFMSPVTHFNSAVPDSK